MQDVRRAAQGIWRRFPRDSGRSHSESPPWRNSPEIHDRSAVGSAKGQVSPVWAVKKVRHITDFLCAIGQEDSLDHPVPGRYISNSGPLSQAVRPRIANPLPPVRIREGPLQKKHLQIHYLSAAPYKGAVFFCPHGSPDFRIRKQHTFGHRTPFHASSACLLTVFRWQLARRAAPRRN